MKGHAPIKLPDVPPGEDVQFKKVLPLHCFAYSGELFLRLDPQAGNDAVSLTTGMTSCFRFDQPVQPVNVEVSIV